MRTTTIEQGVLFGKPDVHKPELFGDDLYRALKDIESRDPDGGPILPTEARYAAHKAWAVDVYGVAVWERYSVGGFDEPTW